MLTRDWQSGYQLSLLVKDLKIAKQVIESVGIKSELPDLAVKMFSESLEIADPGGCHTQIMLGYEKRAGIQLDKVDKAHEDTFA